MYKGGVTNRRQRAQLRLEEQLTSGLKPVNEFSGADPIPDVRMYPLEEKDIIRIKKEIGVLKQRA